MWDFLQLEVRFIWAALLIAIEVIVILLFLLKAIA